MRSTLQILCIGLALISQLIAAPESLVQSVTYSGETVTMRLNRENLRGANFELWSQNSTGGYDEVTPVAERSYLGTVDGYPGAVSCGVQLDDGSFKGAIYFDRGATWFTLGESVIETRALDYGNFTNFQYPASSTVSPGQAGTSIYAFDLGVDADHNYFTDASSRVETAFERIEYSIAVTRAIYMRDTLLRPYLGRVIIRSSAGQDPYTGLTQGSYLDALRSHWNNNHQDADRDVVCGVSPSKIGGGLAWVGVIATSSAYSVNQANGSGAFDVVFRHELGHNWNCGHFVGGSPEGTGLMGGNAPGRFSGCEAYRVLEHRNNRISSLENEGTFTNVELPPYASMDAIGYIQTGGPQSIDVLANDHDANGQPISLESFDPTSRFGGSLSRVGNELVYTAPGSFIGTDSFTYRITDSAGLTATGAVAINVQTGDPLRLYLPLDETTGTATADFSVYQNIGSLAGTDFATASTSGVFGSAPSLDGDNDSISISGVQLQSDTVTICGWIKPSGDQNGFAGIVFDRSGEACGLNFAEGNQLGYHWNDSYWWLNTGLVPPQDTWTFVALVINGPSGATIHMNSGSGFSSWSNNSSHGVGQFGTVYVGRDPGNSSRYFNGAIDDVRIYSRALTEEELLDIISGGRVEGPSPFDGATDVRNPEFSWSPAGNAESYEIYLGTNESSVANADSSSPEFIGATSERTRVVDLMPNTTYYWRVDEVKPSETTTGTVWTFTTANKVDEFGLIAHWKMDELDGNNLLDSTRNSHTGTINGPTRSSGFEGGALTFDGIDDSVTFGSGPALSGTSDFTLSTWVKTTATTDQVVIQQRNGGYNGQYQLRVRETGAVSFYVYGNLATQFDFATNLSVNDGEWHHIVAVRDGENGHIYIDGDPTPAASAIGTLRDLDSSIGVGIGRDIRDNIRPFSGQIDEVKIYSLAKSGTEIQQAYNQYLNQAPSWKTEPLMIPDAIEGVSYTTNLNESATDPNGDPLTFSYLNGPSWLSIAPTGELSGTPSREDAGQQSWTVSVSDGVNPAVETIIYLTVLADTDGDGIPDSIDLDDDNDEIPDAWEIQYGLNPLLADANDNPDGDRYNNLTEYLFDTNPLEASSEQVLRVEAGDALGSLQLRYQSSADRVYTLEASPNLENGIWQRFTEPSPGTDSEVFVPIVPSDDKRFFRLRVELP